MKTMLVTLAVVAALAGAACGATNGSSTSASTTASDMSSVLPQNVMYGHIRAMSRKGGHYEMKFDPAWWLNGTAAEHAALENTGSRDVPNDYIIVEEGHRLLTFTVLPSARITVITPGPSRGSVTAAQLVQIVQGKTPAGVHPFEPQAGYWIRIGKKYPNPAVTIDQQYQP